MTDPLSPAASYPDPIGDRVLVIGTGDGIAQAVVTTRFARNGRAACEQEFRNSPRLRQNEEDVFATNATKIQPSAEPPRLWEPIEDWSELKGQMIEIHSSGRVIDRGRVDAVMADGSALWLMHEGVSGRRMIERQKGIYIRTDSK